VHKLKRLTFNESDGFLNIFRYDIYIYSYIVVAHYIQQLYVGMPLDKLKEATDNGASVIETAKKGE